MNLQKIRLWHCQSLDLMSSAKTNFKAGFLKHERLRKIMMMLDKSEYWISMNDFKQLVDQFGRQGISGTLFGVTEKNHSITVMLTGGRITGLYFRGRFGMAVLDELKSNTVERVRCKCTSKTFLPVDLNLPETCIVLDSFCRKEVAE